VTKNSGFVAELGVRDVEAAVTFYTSILGCQIVENAADEHGWFWAEVAFGPSRLMFQRAEMLSAELPGITAEPVQPRAALVLRIEPSSAAADLAERLTSAGRQVDTGPVKTDYGSYEFSFRDLDGFVIVVAGRD
jgi:catechol 2,3-dioxygenase-like lactoylglutathione lyase family enzyme